jgi:hypothetical protein
MRLERPYQGRFGGLRRPTMSAPRPELAGFGPVRRGTVGGGAWVFIVAAPRHREMAGISVSASTRTRSAGAGGRRQGGEVTCRPGEAVLRGEGLGERHHDPAHAQAPLRPDLDPASLRNRCRPRQARRRLCRPSAPPAGPHGPHDACPPNPDPETRPPPNSGCASP